MRRRALRQSIFVLALAAGAAVGVSFPALAGDDAAHVDPIVEGVSDRTVRDLLLDPGSAPPDTDIALEVYGPDLDAVADVIRQIGGTPYGEVPGWFVEADVPVSALRALQSSPATVRLATVTRTSAATGTGALNSPPDDALQQTVDNTLQLAAWHDAGYRGGGEKIGILDTFGQQEFDLAITEGRLPQPAGVFCRRFGSFCSITHVSSEPHGVGVAEIAHRTAPDAEIYLATAYTLGDLSAAVDWFIEEGVTIINRSETSQFDGPGDGTGPVNSIIDRAVDEDIVFVSAAGNAGGRGNRLGQNWLGTFHDPDGNNIHNWASGSERMEFRCGFLLGMRWDDWYTGDVPTDYDLWIYDSVDATTPEARGNDIQGSVGDPALEHISPVCDSVNDLDYLSIARFGDPAPDGPDTLQILGNFTPMEEWTNASSATGPGADSANPGALTVGATLRPSSLVLADYSSQGPTLDARVGVDLIAASCLPVDNFPGCFTGTSASAPLVTGTLAVLRDAGVFDAATTVHSVIPDIVLDQGANGPDVAYGTGSFRLPPPIDFGIVPVDELCFGLAPTITGTDDADIINGTPGDDIIRAGAGDDLIFGGGGHDVICGEDGRDTIYGGRGRDHIDGGDRRDRIWGEAGADTIMGGLGLDRIVGNLGNDVIHGLGNHDLIKGGPGDDTIRGGSGDDRIEGGDGGDTINGGNGTDACVGSGPGLPADPGDVMSRCE